MAKRNHVKGAALAKLMNIRHGHGPRRGCNAVEKAVETRVRQAGKLEVREALRDK